MKWIKLVAAMLASVLLLAGCSKAGSGGNGTGGESLQTPAIPSVSDPIGTRDPSVTSPVSDTGTKDPDPIKLVGKFEEKKSDTFSVYIKWWADVYDDLTATVTVELHLACFAITTPEHAGAITVNGKTQTFSTPQIVIKVNSAQDLPLAKMTFDVKLDKNDPAIELEAEWEFNQTYNGTKIDTVTLSDRTVVSELVTGTGESVTTEKPSQTTEVPSGSESTGTKEPPVTSPVPDEGETDPAPIKLVGRFDAKKSDTFTVYVTWTAEVNDDLTATVKVSLYLKCLAITTAKCPGSITVNGTTQTFFSPQIIIKVNETQDLRLTEMTFDVKLDKNDPAIELEAEWAFNQTYNGTKIDTVVLSDKTLIAELAEKGESGTQEIVEKTSPQTETDENEK